MKRAEIGERVDTDLLGSPLDRFPPPRGAFRRPLHPAIEPLGRPRPRRRGGSTWLISFTLDPPHPAALVVTGSSLTADIEKQVVIPAHGHPRLDVLFLPEPPDLPRLRDLVHR